MHAPRLPLLISSTVIGLMTLAGCTQQMPPQAGTSPQGSTTSSTQANMQEPEHVSFTQAEVIWMDAPPVLPTGAKIAVLDGDPSKASQFTLRLKFPADYKIPPHWHPADEHVTVISGTLAIGMGQSFSKAALKELGVGGFAMMRAHSPHFAWSKDGAVVQLNGVGPWGLTYVNPTDDPRNATK